jgi:putative salt-induced outer membrane protein YdiY
MGGGSISNGVRCHLPFTLLTWVLPIIVLAESMDRIQTKEGAILIGRILSQTETHYLIQTDYAGELKVLVSRVERVERAGAEAVKAAVPSAPVVVVEKAVGALAGSGSGREKDDWKFEGGLNLTGKSGNTDRFDLAVNLKAEWERSHDRFDFFGRYAYGTNRGLEAIDELIVGTRYTNFYFDGAGFFAREELEFDKFEGLSLRSTTAAGFSYQFRNDKNLRIEARSGFSYRYETYLDSDPEDFPGMDVGVDINWEVWDRLRFKGSYTFVPSVENLGDYIFEQDSGVSLPLDNKAFWSIRFGVATQFNSMPEGMREKLDTRYYTQIRASWK